MSPVYDFVCSSCNEKREQYGSIAQPVPVVKCPKCKKKMSLNISGGTDIHGSKKPVSMGVKCLQTQVDRNTDRMSLDEKIHWGTNKYRTTNESIKPEYAERDQKDKIDKEIKKITKYHRS